MKPDQLTAPAITTAAQDVLSDVDRALASIDAPPIPYRRFAVAPLNEPVYVEQHWDDDKADAPALTDIMPDSIQPPAPHFVRDPTAAAMTGDMLSPQGAAAPAAAWQSQASIIDLATLQRLISASQPDQPARVEASYQVKDLFRIL